MHNVRFLKFSKEGTPQLMFSVMHQISDPNLKNKQVLIISRLKEGKEKIVQEKTFYPIFENGTLTRKELEVWKLLGEGLSSKAIAEKMNIKLNTVLTHRKKINKKLKFQKD
jgi:DNA-binding NarL/FixJ family response regulator